MYKLSEDEPKVRRKHVYTSVTPRTHHHYAPSCQCVVSQLGIHTPDALDKGRGGGKKKGECCWVHIILLLS